MFSSRIPALGHAARLMEKVGVAIALEEPILLVGDTGSGKTSLIQHLAEMVGALKILLACLT